MVKQKKIKKLKDCTSNLSSIFFNMCTSSVFHYLVKFVFKKNLNKTLKSEYLSSYLFWNIQIITFANQLCLEKNKVEDPLWKYLGFT